MKVIRLLIGAITVSLIFSGMAVAVENPQEQITIEGVRPAVFDYETGSLRILKIVMNKQCKGCHFNGVDGVKGTTR